MHQAGTNYADAAEVQVYDSRMQKLRNIKEEIESIINCLGLTPGQTILDFGSGTGEFAFEAAQRCARVFAVDVSPAMLEFARRKAKLRGIKNVEFHQAGFLTYNHSGGPLDAGFSQLALHHLPDFWKMIALKRIFAMLKEGGKFYLRDIVYSFAVGNYMNFFHEWVDGVRQVAGEELACDIKRHIRDEYTTLDWIMEGLLEKAGFTINSASYDEGYMAVYVCTASLRNY